VQSGCVEAWQLLLVRGQIRHLQDARKEALRACLGLSSLRTSLSNLFSDEQLHVHMSSLVDLNCFMTSMESFTSSLNDEHGYVFM
jgi:hypothetical protein